MAKSRDISLNTPRAIECFLLTSTVKVKTHHDKNDSIIFRNLFVPFFKKERSFSYYDYSKTIAERSQFTKYESLWLIKNGKVEDEVSSFIFSNYAKLKFEIKVKYKGKLKIDTFKQVACSLGKKI